MMSISAPIKNQEHHGIKAAGHDPIINSGWIFIPQNVSKKHLGQENQNIAVEYCKAAFKVTMRS